MGESLYDTDFYSWADREARLLKAGAFDRVDLDNIIEEIETLGRSEQAALESHYVVLCTHLLKGMFQRDDDRRLAEKHPE